MLTPIVLVIVLMVATCVIAYWSDNLGKKLGKKRITLFNLRPRQTATLITMASSVGIMLLTLAGLLYVNKSLRHALFRYDMQVRDNNRLNDEIAKKNRRLARTQQETKDANSAKLKAQQERQKSELDRRKAEQDRQQAVQGRNTAHRELQQAQGELETAQRKLRVAQTGRQTAEAGRRAATQGRQIAEEQARRAEKRVNVALARYAQAQARLTQAQTRLTQAQGRLAQAQSRLAHAETRLAQAEAKTSQAEANARHAELGATQARNISLRAQQDAAKSSKVGIDAKVQADQYKGQVEQYKGQALQAKTEADKAQLRLAQVQEDLRRAKEISDITVEGLGTGKLLTTNETVLASETLRAQLTRSELETAMRRVLSAGTNAARQLGTKQQPVEGVVLQDLNFKNPDGQISTIAVTSEQIIPTLAQHLENSPTPISLLLVPSRLHAIGETQIHSRFLYVPVRKILSHGDVLALIEVNPRNSDAQLFESLEVLTEQGKQANPSINALPLLTPQGGFYAPGTFERLFEAVRQVQSWGKAHPDAKTVEVRLVADADITSAEQLRVRFEIASS